MIRHINNDLLETEDMPSIQHRRLEKPCRLVVQECLPPFGGYKFRQDHGRQLPVVVLPVGRVEKINDRMDDRTIRRLHHRKRDIRKEAVPPLLHRI
jgi:hypothetical protein